MTEITSSCISGSTGALYEYNTHGQVIRSAEDFIAHINSGGKQGGSVSWRYVLVEETMEIPAMSLWTMCEIWRAVCCRVKTKALDRQGDCSRLSRMLAFRFGRLVLHTIPVPYVEFTDEVNEWIVGVTAPSSEDATATGTPNVAQPLLAWHHPLKGRSPRNAR